MCGLPEKTEGGGISGDIGLSAFLLFSCSGAFLSYQVRSRRPQDLELPYSVGMAKITTDNQSFDGLDPGNPSHSILVRSSDATLARGGGLKEFERYGGRALIALDGNDYFCCKGSVSAKCQRATLERQDRM